MPMPDKSAAATAAGDGNRRVRPSNGVATGVPARSMMRPTIVVAPATVTCWPTMARMAISQGSQAPGTRRPGRASTALRSRGSADSTRAIVAGSASRSNTRRTRAMTRSRCAPSDALARTSR